MGKISTPEMFIAGMIGVLVILLVWKVILGKRKQASKKLLQEEMDRYYQFMDEVQIAAPQINIDKKTVGVQLHIEKEDGDNGFGMQKPVVEFPIEDCMSDYFPEHTIALFVSRSWMNAENEINELHEFLDGYVDRKKEDSEDEYTLMERVALMRDIDLTESDYELPPDEELLEVGQFDQGVKKIDERLEVITRVVGEVQELAAKTLEHLDLEGKMPSEKDFVEKDELGRPLLTEEEIQRVLRFGKYLNKEHNDELVPFFENFSDEDFKKESAICLELLSRVWDGNIQDKGPFPQEIVSKRNKFRPKVSGKTGTGDLKEFYVYPEHEAEAKAEEEAQVKAKGEEPKLDRHGRKIVGSVRDFKGAKTELNPKADFEERVFAVLGDEARGLSLTEAWDKLAETYNAAAEELTLIDHTASESLGEMNIETDLSTSGKVKLVCSLYQEFLELKEDDEDDFEVCDSPGYDDDCSDCCGGCEDDDVTCFECGVVEDVRKVLEGSKIQVHGLPENANTAQRVQLWIEATNKEIEYHQKVEEGVRHLKLELLKSLRKFREENPKLVGTFSERSKVIDLFNQFETWTEAVHKELLEKITQANVDLEANDKEREFLVQQVGELQVRVDDKEAMIKEMVHAVINKIPGQPQGKVNKSEGFRSGSVCVTKNGEPPKVTGSSTTITATDVVGGVSREELADALESTVEMIYDELVQNTAFGSYASKYSFVDRTKSKILQNIRNKKSDKS